MDNIPHPPKMALMKNTSPQKVPSRKISPMENAPPPPSTEEKRARKFRAYVNVQIEVEMFWY